MKRCLFPILALLALAAPVAANAATASELKLDWKMTASAAPAATTATKSVSSTLFAWLPFSVWSGWMQLSTTSPGTILFVK